MIELMITLIFVFLIILGINAYITFTTMDVVSIALSVSQLILSVIGLAIVGWILKEKSYNKSTAQEAIPMTA